MIHTRRKKHRCPQQIGVQSTWARELEHSSVGLEVGIAWRVPLARYGFCKGFSLEFATLTQELCYRKKRESRNEHKNILKHLKHQGRLFLRHCSNLICTFDRVLGHNSAALMAAVAQKCHTEITRCVWLLHGCRSMDWNIQNARKPFCMYIGLFCIAELWKTALQSMHVQLTASKAVGVASRSVHQLLHCDCYICMIL